MQSKTVLMTDRRTEVVVCAAKISRDQRIVLTRDSDRGPNNLSET